MRRDRRTPLEDHTNAVERLAQTAFSHATGADRKRLVYNEFFRSVNDPDLQRYWLAAKVSSLEKPWRSGKLIFKWKGFEGRASPPPDCQGRWRDHPTSNPPGVSGNDKVTRANAAHHVDEHSDGPAGYDDRVAEQPGG